MNSALNHSALLKQWWLKQVSLLLHDHLKFAAVVMTLKEFTLILQTQGSRCQGNRLVRFLVDILHHSKFNLWKESRSIEHVLLCVSLGGLAWVVLTHCCSEITYSYRCVACCLLKPEYRCVLLGVVGATEASRFSASCLTLCRSAGRRV